MATTTIIGFMIAYQAMIADISPKEALDIAYCESRLDPKAKNPNSSATGIFQFTIGTWNWTKCKGERTNAYDSTKCFMKYYKKYPHWWVCSKHYQLARKI